MGLPKEFQLNSKKHPTAEGRSALQYRQFFLYKCDSDSSDWLQHNNVRWLSKSQVIFWLIKEQVTSFLQNLDMQEAM